MFTNAFYRPLGMIETKTLIIKMFRKIDKSKEILQREAQREKDRVLSQSPMSILSYSKDGFNATEKVPLLHTIFAGGNVKKSAQICRITHIHAKMGEFNAHYSHYDK